MSAKMRRMSAAQADREVVREVKMFTDGLQEDIPERETGDNRTTGLNANVIQGFTKGINVIPTGKTLRCRPAPFDIANGQFPTTGILAIAPNENVVIMDSNAYGYAIAFTDLGNLFYHIPGDTQPWHLYTFNPLYGQAISPLDMSLNKINKKWIVDFNNGSFALRIQIDLTDTLQPVQAIGMDSADVPTYMRGLPSFNAVSGEISPSLPQAYIYDFLFTWVYTNTAGVIIRESGTWNETGYQWNPGGQTGEYFRIYTKDPLEAGNDVWLDFNSCARFPGDTFTHNLNYPLGYNGIAVYRTSNKSANTPDITANTTANSQGGLLNLQFNLVGIFSTFDGHASINKSDTEIAATRLCETWQYVPVPYTNMSIIVNGIYLAAKEDIVYYSDLGATPEALGWCYPGIQEIQLEEPATAMAQLQNSAVICSNGYTWKFPIDGIVYLTSSIPGRVLSQIQSYTTIKTNGVSKLNRFSLINWSNTAIIAFCSDHSIRTFDGAKWTDDLAWLKVARRLTHVTQSFMHFDYRGFMLFNYLNSSNNKWECLRMGLRSEAAAAFSEFGGNDWPVDRLINFPFLAAGDNFMMNNAVAGGSGSLLWDSAKKKIVAYGEMEDYFYNPTTSPCIIRFGTFTGDHMSYWTIHTESHIYFDSNYISNLTPGNITAKVTGLHAGTNSAAFDGSEIIGNFSEGCDVSFQKYLGAYRGFDIEFTLPYGGYEIVGVDTHYRVIDRPIWNPQNQDVNLSADWAAALWSRTLTRYSILADLCNPKTLVLPYDSNFQSFNDPISEVSEPGWTFYSVHPVELQFPTPPSFTAIIFSIWFRSQADADADPQIFQVFGQEARVYYDVISASTQVSLNGTRLTGAAGVYSKDGQWHLIAVGYDTVTNTAMAGIDGVLGPVTPVTLNGFEDFVQFGGNPEIWDACFLDPHKIKDVPATFANYYSNVRNYCKP